MSHAVAITGIGVLSGFGIGTEPFWEGLVAGRSAIGALPGGPGRRGAVVPPIELRAFARTPAARRIDRVSLLTLAASRLALADAGLAPESFEPARTALALGSAFGNVAETVDFLDRLIARGAGNAFVFPNLVMNAPLSYASIELVIRGPSLMVTEQEATGEAAVLAGAELIASGAADVCLAGAADELHAVLHDILRDGGALAAETPRPLDAAADGPCPGEGAALLVLEPMARARARGARVYARLVPHAGFGVPAPVHGWPQDPGPIADGLRSLVADADLVVAGASGAPARDRIEAAALARARGERRVPVTAPRGALGDFGSAGALGVAVAALAIANGIVPPTTGLLGTPRAGLDVVGGGARRQPIGAVVVDGLARGGICRPVRLEAA